MPELESNGKQTKEKILDDEESEEDFRMIKHKWYHIDPYAIPSKCAFFFECAMRSGLQPNLVMFLTSIGLNKAEAGFIVGLRYTFFFFIRTSKIF